MYPRCLVLASLAGLSLFAGCTTADRRAAPPAAADRPAASHFLMSDKTLDVWLLDVGQGSCAFVTCPDERSAMLIDCGSSAAGGTPLPAISAWINAKMAAADRTTIVVSHADKDHMSLLADDAITPTFVTRLLIGRTLEEYPPHFQRWAAQAPARPQTFGPSEVSPADPRLACGPAQSDVLTANSTMDEMSGTFGSSKNADSVIIRMRYGTSSVIFTGDAEGQTEQQAIDNAAARALPLDSTTLLLGSHHGAKTAGSNGSPWLEATRPQAVAYSARLASSYHHPQCDAIERALGTVGAVATAFEFTCGVGNAGTDRRSVKHRLLSTHINGHILARMGRTSTVYLCEKMSPACDAPLESMHTPTGYAAAWSAKLPGAARPAESASSDAPEHVGMVESAPSGPRP